MPKIKISEIPDLDVAELLTNDEARAGFLDLALRTGDQADIADSLDVVARSVRRSRAAEVEGGGGEEDKTLKVGRNPRLSTLLAIIQEIGMELRVGPAKSEASLLHRRRRAATKRETS
jgi:DNA-binding phage protein